MKISFKKLKTADDNIRVSFDNKNTFENYNKNTALADGITIPDECTDFSNIVVKTDKSEITDLVYEIPTDLLSQGDLNSKLDTRIKKLKMPDGVTTIGNCAFRGCSNLTSISIPDSVTSIGNGAFETCGKLTSIEIPDSVTSISAYTFNGCSKLTSISIPDSVTSIGESAFYNCISLTSIAISDSVTSIGNCAFYNCKSLTSIAVSDNNNNYSADEYALYNKNKTKIIQFYNRSITTFNMPNTVTSIANFAFDGCSSLTSITIPEGITSIGNVAFMNCSGLTIINYRGTEEQWNNITKGNNWDKNCPAVVNYNYIN